MLFSLCFDDLLLYNCVLNLIFRFKNQETVLMLRWFLFFMAILLLTLGGALAGLILVSPSEVKKDDDDE